MLDQTKTCPTVTVAANELRNALAFARMGAKRLNTVPILGMVLIEAEGDELRITSTDLDVEVQAKISAEVSSPVAFTIAPRVLADLLRHAEGHVTISHSANTTTISIGDLSAEFRMMCPAEDWPWLRFDQHTSGGVSEIGEEKLRRALSACSICISTEETRYYLNGVFLEACDGLLRTVSTDGHRMSVYDTGETWTAPNAILPRAAVPIIASRLRRGGNGTVRVRHFAWEGRIKRKPGKDGIPVEDEIRIRVGFEFHGDGWRIRSKTIDGTFPNYRRVIPAIPPDGAPFSVTLSAAALRRFPDVPHASRCVAINPDAGSMQMSAFGEVKVTMPVQGKGGKVGFNLRYLLAFATRAGVIKLEGDGELNAYLVSTDDPALTQVIMSMRY
ncbi:DNA polymerase III subunit beta [Cereibacter azotoformans]|uniref:DNA polymerase III subunit beta n=1 Tax=Cereibacter azotoformans TaxID=43057 RepID=UPI003B227B2E